MDMTEKADGVGDKLASSLRMMIKDAEELLKNTGQQANEGYDSARARFETTLKSAKSGLSDLEETVMSRTKDAAETTDQYVRDHPWQAVGVGALAGLVCGLVLGRSR